MKRFALLLALAACSGKSGDKAKAHASASASAGSPGDAAEALAIRPLPDLPFGLPPPPSNPRVTAEAVARGEQLFVDKELSASGKSSCATCHDPAHGFSGKVDVAADGKMNMRRTPALVNLAWTKDFGWDGRYASFSDLLLAHIKGQLGGTDTSPETLQALEAFVFTRYAGNSLWDRKERSTRATPGEAATDPVVAGYQLFMGKARCGVCHPPPLYTDGAYHIVADNPINDPARGRVDPAKAGAFKTPTLRGAAERTAFFHNGSAKSLADAIGHYRTAAQSFPELDGIHLTEAEAAQLVAFVEALTPTTR